MRNSIVLLSLLALLPACALGEFHAFTDDLDAQGTESGSTTGDADSSGDLSGPISTVTSATSSSSGEPTAGDTDGATSEVDATTGEPAGPPAISDYSLTPNPITSAGVIAVKILADGDGVRMDADGVVVELTATEPGVFEGELFAFSGFDNGGFEAVFVPWREVDGEQIEGEARVVPYTIELPAPGGEALWDVDYASGSGQVTAIGALQDGVIELVTLVSDNTSGCVLRRRDENGISGPDDLVVIAPDHCKGIDLEVGDDGIYVLVEGDSIWWLAKMPFPFGGPPAKSIGYGGKDEHAHALALSPSGAIAVCGSAPTPQPGDLSDAMVRIFQPDFSSLTKTFDHSKDLGHTFDEKALGCEFDRINVDRLIVVGDVLGKHGFQNVKSRHRFDLAFDPETDQGDLRVADVGLAAQSVASDVAVDDQGRAFIVGHICGNDPCDQVEGQMWMLDAEGDLASTTSLGLHTIEALAPAAIRVSPAGYVVVASGGLTGNERAFLVRAYAALKAEPLWTFSRQDAGLIHLAHALAIGRFGQVYAGGFGDDGFPSFVIIDG